MTTVPSGIQRRYVIQVVTTIVSLPAATIAVVGLLLLTVVTVTTRTAWALRKMAKSIRQTTAIARAVGLSAVSKNKNDILSA